MYSATVIGPPRNLMMLARCASRPLSFLPSSASAPSPCCASSMARNRPVRSMAISSARRTEPSGSAASSAPAAGDQPGGGGAAGGGGGGGGVRAVVPGIVQRRGDPGRNRPRTTRTREGEATRGRTSGGDARRRRAHHRASPSQGTTQTRPSRERAPASEPAALAAPRRARRAERASARRMRAADGRERERASKNWGSTVILNAQKRRELGCRPGGAHRKTRSRACTLSSHPPRIWIDSIGRRPTPDRWLARSPFKRALVSDRRRARPIDARSCRTRSILRRARHARVLRGGRLRAEDLGSLTVRRASVGESRPLIRSAKTRLRTHLRWAVRAGSPRGAAPGPRDRGARARDARVSRPASPLAAELALDFLRGRPLRVELSKPPDRDSVGRGDAPPKREMVGAPRAVEERSLSGPTRARPRRAEIAPPLVPRRRPRGSSRRRRGSSRRDVEAPRR